MVRITAKQASVRAGRAGLLKALESLHIFSSFLETLFLASLLAIVNQLETCDILNTTATLYDVRTSAQPAGGAISVN